jgi:hypothetical protein
MGFKTYLNKKLVPVHYGIMWVHCEPLVIDEPQLSCKGSTSVNLSSTLLNLGSTLFNLGSTWFNLGATLFNLLSKLSYFLLTLPR